tara:strand:+ start:595 stop:1398 length:804 start_codon:yes stop_codon:yes gene_type:complete
LNKFIKLSDGSSSLSRIGFGCSRLDNADLIESRTVIEECIFSGITHFDTAPSYGTESLLGEIITSTRDVTISSKTGRDRNEYKKSDLALLKKIYKKSIKPIINLSPTIKNKVTKRFFKEKDYQSRKKRKLVKDEVLIELDKTLKNLKRDKLDILLIHEPDQFIIDEELNELFKDLIKDGYIKEYGLGFGRGNPDIDFGRVSQSKYTGSLCGISNRINIYHGVVKKSLEIGNDSKMHFHYIRNILEQDDNNMVLFSSNRPKHIKSFLL